MKPTDNKTASYFMGGFAALADLHDEELEFVVCDEVKLWAQIVEDAKINADIAEGSEEYGDDGEAAIFWATAKENLAWFVNIITLVEDHDECEPECPVIARCKGCRITGANPKVKGRSESLNSRDSGYATQLWAEIKDLTLTRTHEERVVIALNYNGLTYSPRIVPATCPMLK